MCRIVAGLLRPWVVGSMLWGSPRDHPMHPAAANLAARQTLKPVGNGAREVAASWSAATIPATWTKAAVLGRACGCAALELFTFYALPDGRVAKITHHPMNGPDELFVAVDTAEAMRADWAELLAGEPWEERASIGCGRMDVRRGARPKAHRVG